MEQPMWNTKRFETKRYTEQPIKQFMKPSNKQVYKPVKRNKLNQTKAYLVELSEKTTIHGVGQFTQTERHPMECVLWVVVVLGSIACTVELCLSTYNRFHDNPTVISVERNYNEWMIPFPSAFICPLVNYDELEVNNTAKRLVGKEGNPEKITKMIDFLKTLSQVSYDNFNTLSSFSGDKSLPQSSFEQLINEIKHNFSFNLRANGWARENTDSNKEMCAMKTMLSERGLCYGHNSPFSALKDRSGKPSTRLFCNATMEKVHNYLTVNRIETASAFELSQLFTAYEMLWLPPVEFPTITGRSLKVLDPKSVNEVNLIVQMFLVSTDAVKELDIERRNCRLNHESNLTAYPIYSFKTCIVDCRNRLAHHLCACVPFFSHVEGDESEDKVEGFAECDVDGMLCLARHSDKLKGIVVKDCGCLPECELTAIERAATRPITSSASTESIMRNTVWKIQGFPKLKYRRDVLFTFTDLLVGFGGTAGLFLGCSLISLVELVYFFSLRLLLHIRAKTKPEQ